MNHRDNRPLLLGVDGGGSKTMAWLARLDEAGQPQEVGRARGGASNPRAVGFEGAQANLLATIDHARHAAGLPPGTPFDAACLAIAGTGRDAERQWLEGLVHQHHIARRCRIVHDALPVLAAASETLVGVALIAGTGSLAYGCDSAGRTARAGGWGYLFGDEGSGYWIAIEGLRSAARAADGRGPRTVLVEQFQQRLGVTTPEGLITALYGGDTRRVAIASLAEVVLGAAAGEDSVALEILTRAASELASMVAAVAHELKLHTAPLTLGLAGGVLLGSELLRTRLEQQLALHRLSPATLALVADPVAGALRLAMHEFAGT